MLNEICRDASSGERRQHPDVRHGRMADLGSTGKGQRARHGVGGTGELVVDESTDRAAGFEQSGDLSRREAGQTREPDHRSAEHIGRGKKIVFADKYADVGGHPDIMSRELILRSAAR